METQQDMTPETGTTPIEATLTARQRAILDVLRESVAARGYPPSIRELGERVELRSPSSVHNQLAALERAGLIRRDPTKSRAVELLPLAWQSHERPEWQRAEVASESPAPGVVVPLVGDIAAGAPILADEHIEEQLRLPGDLVGHGTLFALHVRGDSMIDDGILDGDTVVIRQQATVEQGELCAALVNGEATVKRFRREADGSVWLDPANERYAPIPVAEDAAASILGRVVAVLRSL